MYIYKSNKTNQEYVVKSISYSYENKYMTEDNIKEMFADMVDCIGSFMVEKEELLEMSIISKLKFLINGKMVEMIKMGNVDLLERV